MTEYFFVCIDDNGEQEAVQLKATNDKQAVKEMRKLVGQSPTPEGLAVCLAWHRDSDGCHGFLTPDGTAISTGAAWPNLVVPIIVEENHREGH
jgi:hypothetical protein